MPISTLKYDTLVYIIEKQHLINTSTLYYKLLVIYKCLHGKINQRWHTCLIK